MSVLFEIVKNPELEQAAEGEDTAPAINEEPHQSSRFPVEIQRLRQRAMEVDAGDAAQRIIAGSRPLLDDQAQEFVAKCLEAGPVAAETPQRNVPHLLDPRYDFLLRVCSVPLIVGDWKTVVSGRESALAAAAELSARGYASPTHRFGRCGSGWTLSLKFGF